ncbi:hypothetical protein L2E82_39955 [Cichorium intybus]|uniref:Uncharacterized protein n=1 Tax=Cichorium intybus TaxID=13427 RepID=A0ACB9AJP3_CICIN|nr:hypothetical protein L2E82_39955 [Cichorium intybus]
MSWKGEFDGALDVDFHFNIENGHTKMSNGVVPSSHSRKSGISYMELSLPLRLLFVLFSDEQLVLCSISKRGLKQADSVKPEYRLGSGDAVCASISPDQQILAVGTRRGVIELYEISEPVSLIRSVSLHDWGYSMDDTGAVSSISWTPDSSAFAVGWKLRGLTVWSISGCRLIEDGMYLAVAGLHGLILYDIRLNRWRFFGDVTQEQKIQCTGLLWMGKIVVVCNYIEATDM